jgi:hypothetical protein
MLTKGVFIKWYTCFLSFVASNQRALTPAVRRYCFADIFPMSSSFFDMISDKGGGRHGHHVCVRSIVGGGVNDCDPKWRTAWQQKLARRRDGEGGGTAIARAAAGWQGRRRTATICQARPLQLVAADDGRGGRTLTCKGRGPARRRRHAIKLIFTKLRNSFVEFNGTGEDDDEIICMSTNRIYMEWWWDTLSYNKYHKNS